MFVIDPDRHGRLQSVQLVRGEAATSADPTSDSTGVEGGCGRFVGRLRESEDDRAWYRSFLLSPQEARDCQRVFEMGQLTGSSFKAKTPIRIPI